MQTTILKVAAVALLLLTAAAMSQEIPAGTVLPMMLNGSVDVRHDKAGRPISGKLMQDVQLPDGTVIPAGSRISGRIVGVSLATTGAPSRLALQFDQVRFGGRQQGVQTHLRALASMNEVFEAKIPTNALDDYGTSPSDWNTVQVGGAGVYRGNGQVVAGDQVVGRATDYGAVTARLTAVRGSSCSNDGGREQALWVFSPWACGVYGFDDLKIAHAGRTDPLGQIVLESNRNVKVSGGTGWLLRVDPAVPSR